MHYQKRILLGIFVIIFLIITSSNLYAEGTMVESEYVNVRNGPGNFYNIISRLYKGTELKILDTIDGWYKISLPDNKTGFVSKPSIKKRNTNEGGDRYYDYKNKEGVGVPASSEIMAATKGVVYLGEFAKGYAAKNKIDPSNLTKFAYNPFSVSEYTDFKKALAKKGGVDIKEASEKGISEIERDIGTAIALNILSNEAVDSDDKIRKYMSMVGNALVETTPMYDEQFLFILLTNNEPRSFAVPGGYIFVTTGALKYMKSEADLAGLLAHEIMHVVEGHGLQELTNQKERIKSKKIMDELDAAIVERGMESPDAEIAGELEDMADKMFEVIIGGRNRADEDESDRLGTILLSNTGYSADGLKRFLSALSVIDTDKGESSSHNIYKNRIEKIDAVIKEKQLGINKKTLFTERFLR